MKHSRHDRGFVDVGTLALTAALGLVLPVLAVHRAPRPVGPLAICVAHHAARCPAIVPDPPAMTVAEVERIVRLAAHDTGVPRRLLRAVAIQESGLQSSAVSTAGAVGIMQTLPAVAAEEGCNTLSDVRCEVYAGARHFAKLLARYHANVVLALAAYNAGPGAVDHYGGVPPYRETRAYVTAVVAAAQYQPRGAR